MQGHCQSLGNQTLVCNTSFFNDLKAYSNAKLRKWLLRLVVHITLGWWFSARATSERWLFFFGGIGDADFREAIAESVARKSQGASSLTLISIGLAKRFADGFVLPLIESHS